ncbi:MAG: hypothetical protein AB1442_02770 [Nitrospirota bacterium]
MKTILLSLAIVLLLSDTAGAGALFGRIIDDNGRPVAKSAIAIEGANTVTNEFGGYRVVLPDGERELAVTINNVSYVSERIGIYSPETKQNWRIDYKTRRLLKIR